MIKGDNGKVVEENNALIANGQAKANGGEKFSTFIYNREEGTFLGRSAKSWGQLILFYIIFYICLAAFWVVCLAIFLKTIDPNLPRFYGKGSIIGASPGVGFQPLSKEDAESTLIRFNPSDKSSYEKYVNMLDGYLSKYSNVNNTRICTGSESNADIVSGGKVSSNESEACRFSLDLFAKHGCSSDKNYGYDTGKPCVILSLNKLIGWKPADFEEGQIPKDVATRYKPGSIAFRCDGISDLDKEVVGKVEYVPQSGIDGRFYPYAVMANYHQPIAMAKFLSLPKNRVVLVECRAYARNIEQDTVSRLGMVTFELFRVSS